MPRRAPEAVVVVALKELAVVLGLTCGEEMGAVVSACMLARQELGVVVVVTYSEASACSLRPHRTL
jgi:hypothetical protein